MVLAQTVPARVVPARRAALAVWSFGRKEIEYLTEVLSDTKLS